VPQKDERGKRTAKELAVFNSALPVMNKCFASICGTAVVLLKDVPPRPPEYDGRVTIFDLCPSSADEEAVRVDLSRFGNVVEAAVSGTVASARFSSHDEAERCVAALCLESRDACCVYNETHYSRDRGEPFSGWCTAEQAWSSFVAAHLARVERQAAQRSLQLPERFAQAQARHAKVTDISGGETKILKWDVEPAELLEDAFNAIERATFVGKGDRVFVQYRLAEFEWIIRSAMMLATEQAQRRHGTSVGPGRARRLKRGLMRLMGACLSFRVSTVIRRRGNGSNSVAPLTQQGLASHDRQEVAVRAQLSSTATDLSPCRHDHRRRSSVLSVASSVSRRYEALDDDMEGLQVEL